MFRRRALVAALLTNTLALGSVLGASSPAEAAAQVSIHEFNLCGDHCHAGSNFPADVVAYAVGSSAPNPLPLSISLSEVCRSQFNRLVNSLQGFGYTGSWVTTRTAQLSVNCGGSFGNAVFTVGPRINYLTFSYSDDTDPIEVRKGICARSQVPGTDFVGCSLHLTNEDDGTAMQQAAEAIWIINFNYGLFWRFVGGDYNLNPSQMGTWYNSGYLEADHQAHTHDSASIGKVDYIFMAHPECCRLAYIISPLDGFDHHYFHGRYSV